MKKILIFEDVFGLFGGIEKVITNIISLCDKDKYKITLYCNHIISEEYLPFLEKQNVDICQAQSTYISNPIKRHLKGYTLFKKFLKKNKFNVAHFNISNSIDVKYAKIAKKQKINNVIVHCHNDDATSTLKRIAHNFFKQFNNNYATYYVACSESAGKWLYKKSILKSSKYQIIYNGVDTNLFLFNEELRNKYRKEFNATESALLVMHVGRFNKQKNQEKVIDVFNIVHSCNKDSKLVFFGTGSKDRIDSIKDKVKELNLQNDVIFHDPVININEYYNAFDCFLMPSLYEGYGLVFLEAQINGLNCVVSDRIPKIVNFSPLSTMLSIDDDNNKWANIVLESNVGNHFDVEKTIDISKYDYKIQAKKIIELYNK